MFDVRSDFTDMNEVKEYFIYFFGNITIIKR